ncbi:DUF4871 domain-containing protein [Paenibacillus sp. LC231]|uniref:DUF4871 domain-containing protein n=1 Tax=Paenibacillus sp. LC231 TaxID=1120679 RepID=UPI0008DD0404|nr:DUF4871 domain-containing protein [Paenibacillus sp. LC231]OIA99273.1 DUF4871 domain-containing protein [Paenibacillus sp. LC231]
MKTEQELQPDWIQELASSPFNEPMFTEEMKSSVLKNAANGSVRMGRKKRKSPTRLRMMTASVFMLLLIVAAWGWRESPVIQQLIPIKGWGNAADWAPRSVYTEDGVDKLQAFPGGDYAAGSPAGAWWNLLTPIQDLEGKTIRISAVHRDTGITLEELAETKITSDMAYNDFTRVSSRFALPLSGLWRFDVMVDQEKYGDIVVDVPDSSWEPSPRFRSGNYAMTGVEGRLGFIHPGWFNANQPNKYMWHFWGRDEELTGDLHITAVKRNTSEIIDVFKVAGLRPSPLNGADAAIPTSMSLPSPGLWRIMVSIDGQLFDSVIVEVDKPQD